MSARDDNYGSVGAVSGVQNPIRLARAVLGHSLIPNPFGRIPPLLLVSTGAREFAEANSIVTVPPEQLIASEAYTQWKKWKKRLETPEKGLSDIPNDPESENMRDIQDTVGAVSLHPADGFAAGVSSGGLLLKCPGRIGEAGVFGAGCWSNQTQVSAAFEGMACSVSGAGEYIVREQLARKIGDAYRAYGHNDPHAMLHRVLLDFWRVSHGRGETAPAVGVILLTSDREGYVRLWCAFTTASMAVGYVSSLDDKPKTAIFRHPNPKEDGKAQIYITSISLSK
ncbi:N-terminal nucleophile aminohydrolase [Agrocybe pediades]|nr:N-terminal nucleophile aminohydrolase [Agrocybe pediades]